jgi:protein Tex
MDTILQRISIDLSLQQWRIEAAVKLLDGGATVPFIAGYRKEATGGLTGAELRAVQERLRQLRELEARMQAVLQSIAEQGRLTPEVEQAVRQAEDKTRLEDLFLPLKSRRRSRGSVARDAGLEPLACSLLSDPLRNPEQEAVAYVDPSRGVPDVTAALDGARWILMERMSEDADLVRELRAYVWDKGKLQSRVVPGKEQSGGKFSDYFSATEPIKRIPSHRALALFRGRKEGMLRLNVSLEDTEPTTAVGEQPDAPEPEGGRRPLEAAVRRSPGYGEQQIAARYGICNEGREADHWLQETVRLAWKVKILPRLQADAEHRLREEAESDAISLFARNLRDLLLGAPAGARVTMGIDPGLRTGVKVAVVDPGGAVLETCTVHPHQPRNEWDQAIETLAELVRRHAVELIGIGNGTASRETDRLVSQMFRRHPDLHVHKIMVSEAGTSVYASSKVGARELPGLETSARGSVSIARRLQDPLAELVKIEPRGIGVGQYQHDVNQAHLSRALDAVVEDCVSAVGASLNHVSAPVLARMPGLNHRIAENIVAYRNQNGPFVNRQQLLQVPRVSELAYQQAVAFLNITEGDNPLDATRVHPESYQVVARICEATGRTAQGLFGDVSLLRTLAPQDLVTDEAGTATVADILLQLERPARDPRPEFRMPEFCEGIEELADLKQDMVLEGIVTNVASFGAFVDIGVHQDGLVHVSQLANRFVKDPREVVKAGDIVRVKVMEVDAERRRVSLSMRLPETRAAQRSEVHRRPRAAQSSAQRPSPPPARPKIPQPAAATAMAAAFAKLRHKG